MYKVTDMDLISVFCMQISSFFSNIFEEALFSLLYVLGIFVKNNVGVAA
jgi:hypothetical protein